MKHLFKSVFHFIRDIIKFIYFLLRLCNRRCFCNPIKEKYTGTIAVLANGPSLKDVIPLLTKDEVFKNIDFIVMNFFAFDDVFFMIKPKQYCLSDYMFFNDSSRIHEVRKLFNLMQEKIDWKMNLYIPVEYPDFIKFSNITNRNISVIMMNNFIYSGFNSFRNYFYKRGLAMPPINSVAILAIFVCINSGYSSIKLYGVDHNFFDSICVNENNQLCNKTTHFYDNNAIVLSPICDLYKNEEIMKVSEYLADRTKVFVGHDLVSMYAEYMNVDIINCTKHSLIDSYKRL